MSNWEETWKLLLLIFAFLFTAVTVVATVVELALEP